MNENKSILILSFYISFLLASLLADLQRRYHLLLTL